MPVRIIQGGQQPQQVTQQYPLWYSMFGFRARQGQAVPKPTPANLQRFAEHPIIRRAINVLKNPIVELEWEIGAVSGLDMTPDMEKRAAIVRHCFDVPNNDDDWHTLLEQVIDDTLTYAGAIELETSSDPEHPLWLYPVDGSSIRLFVGWSQKANEARYSQYTGYTGGEILLRNDQLCYIRTNPRTSTPFGFTPVECAFNLISAFMSAFTFAQKLAGNATPGYMIDWGPNATPEFLAAMRLYWTDQVEQQGQAPFVGGWGNGDAGREAAASILKLTKGDDSDLRLSWQQWLVRLIALAFDISPQKLNLETSVNRATAEVMAESDDASAIKPLARRIATRLTRDAIWRKLGWYDLEFRFVGIDPDDDLSRSEEWLNLDKADVVLPDELRAEKGLPPLKDGWGQLTYTQRQIKIEQARGAKSEAGNPGNENVLALTDNTDKPAAPAGNPKAPGTMPGDKKEE